MGITPQREITRAIKKYGSAIFPWEIHTWNFKTLACMVNKLRHASDFILIFSKGHNSRMGDNGGQKIVCQLFFHEESIYEIKTLACNVLDERTDGQPETNMPHQLLRSWGHKKGGDTIFPIISQWGPSVAMETRVLIQPAPKPYTAFPPPQRCYT